MEQPPMKQQFCFIFHLVFSILLISWSVCWVSLTHWKLVLSGGGIWTLLVFGVVCQMGMIDTFTWHKEMKHCHISSNSYRSLYGQVVWAKSKREKMPYSYTYLQLYFFYAQKMTFPCSGAGIITSEKSQKMMERGWELFQWRSHNLAVSHCSGHVHSSCQRQKHNCWKSAFLCWVKLMFTISHISMWNTNFTDIHSRVYLCICVHIYVFTITNLHCTGRKQSVHLKHSHSQNGIAVWSVSI